MRRPHLSLAPLCSAAAAGRGDALGPLARAALDAGCTPDEIREALLTVAPFCGFPRTLDALAAVRPLLGPVSRGKGPTGSVPARGAAFFNVVYGKDAERVRANLVAVDPEVAQWIEDDAYGKVLSRPDLPPSLRERIAVVLLAAQGLRNQLSGHLRGALHFGATVTEVSEFLDAAAPFLADGELAFARRTLARVQSVRGDREASSDVS